MMTVQIKMKDELEAFSVDITLSKLVDDLNIAGASGKQFVILATETNEPRMISVPNISWAKQIDDDSAWVA